MKSKHDSCVASHPSSFGASMRSPAIQCATKLRCMLHQLRWGPPPIVKRDFGESVSIAWPLIIKLPTVGSLATASIGWAVATLSESTKLHWITYQTSQIQASVLSSSSHPTLLQDRGGDPRGGGGGGVEREPNIFFCKNQPMPWIQNLEHPLCYKVMKALSNRRIMIPMKLWSQQKKNGINQTYD
jgi:hypothetical protein